uniref:Rho-GAP domain-containing protein n=1 Tax=Vannella robusta TaxID=1487602 RepID=A0A7S4IVF5_9EUKA
MEAIKFNEESLQKASNVAKLQVSSITQSYVRGKNVPWSKFDVPIAFAVLKHFLANLPYPLLTNQLIDCFMMTIEVTREQIPIQTPDASSGTTTHEKVSVKANLNGISQTVNRLPNGHYSTLRCISKVFHSIVKDPQNCITSSQIADYLAFELCNAKENVPKDVMVDEVLKGHKIVESLIDDYPVVFEGAPIEDRDLVPMAGNLQKQFAEQLRSSTMLLQAELQQSLADEEALEDIEPVSNEELNAPGGYLNVDSSKKDEIVLSSNHVGREWMLMGLFSACSLIPLFISFSAMTVVFSIMILAIIYINSPRKEIIIINKTNKTIRKEIRTISAPTVARVHSLDEFQRLAVEQSEKKNGAYRLIMEFKNGITMPVTEGFFFSEKAIAQRAVAAKLKAFLEASVA